MICTSVPAVLADPLLDAKAAQELQVLITTECTWIDKVFALARVGVTKLVSGAAFNYPQAWAANTTTKKSEYIDLRPDDSVNAYSFFESDGAFQFLEDDQVQYPLSLVVWYNLPKLNGTKTYDYSRELAADILRVFDASVYKNKISDLEVNYIPSEIFSKYSMQQEDTQFLMYPYGAFKISFNYINYVELDCLPTFSAGTEACE